MRHTKRETILDTAERLFYAEGFHATGIDRLASEAGVVRMTLYNHFASKDALIEAVLERRYNRYMDDLREAIAQSEPADAIRVLVERHCAWLREHSSRGCIVLRAISDFEQHNPDIAQLGRRLKDELLTVVADAVERETGARDRATSERILVIFEGANALVPILGADAAIEHVHGLLGGMRAPEPAVNE